MLEAFLNTNASTDGVFERVEAEAEGRVPLNHIIKELSALLNLEVVAAIQSPFVHGASHIGLLRLALTAAYKDVKSKHVMDGELLHINALLEGLLVDDDLSDR